MADNDKSIASDVAPKDSPDLGNATETSAPEFAPATPASAAAPASPAPPAAVPVAEAQPINAKPPLLGRLSDNALRALRRVAGALSVIVAIASVCIGLYLFFSSALPDWSYDENSSTYSLDALAKSQASYDEAQATLADPDIEKADREAASNKASAAKFEMKRNNIHALGSFAMRTGAIPSVILFAIWLVLALSSRRRSGMGITTGIVVRNAILYVALGFLFFNVVPGLVADFFSNVSNIIMLVAVIAFVIFIMSKLNNARNGGSGNASVAKGSGGGGGASKKSSGFGGGGASAGSGASGFASAYAAAPQKEKYVHQKKVPGELRLSRRSDSWNGPHIAYYGHDDEWHYVCTQEEYDKGRTEIVDNKGNKREV